jgi:endoglucanase
MAHRADGHGHRSFRSKGIAVKPDLLAEAEDRSRVTLTFHWCSGTTATRSVTKSGNLVTGPAT